MQRKGNYEIQRNYARSVFLKYDQQEILNKLQLKANEDYIYLEFM